ncbi:DEBR0S7_00936g1_1 [Brettanomyces bruxellensis]|uniref:DEBR0S7_00936g1_1 n=1 Tax=Dekkera bruxellensis TaxID=5007 RepID=A0A7D9H4W1_DEKBR|nr:DEBR0S7_00936g1_1 [Brettanomyces bruxellensis]
MGASGFIRQSSGSFLDNMIDDSQVEDSMDPEARREAADWTSERGLVTDIAENEQIAENGQQDETGDDMVDEDGQKDDECQPAGGKDAFAGGIKELEGIGLVDIGNLATWTASSFKPGFGTKEMREDSPLSYWQSDGQQPHFITIHFSKKVSIERICMYLNYEEDESYTPSKILILSGSGDHDLVEVASREFVEPVGWQHVLFKGVRYDNLLKCRLIKICFLSNHQNGKDTHVRCIKVMSLQKNAGTHLDDANPSGVQSLHFTSVKLLSESVIR